ncbi:hypothetical protein PRIPAC_86679 [Pristionchus pacificus]|uniref:Uncharacterized protein n=1 Tax=Pristionchus pacificus TaxID=54126 RepID=A0A2A6BL47_PRIPA|nr:hypothetical protein PRIPAC_86679 [Pristionchus pacificus]|eukprot:PDM66652.1 hypothetical protein PRIPAC_48069 [Pristionchus pacificus]
MPHPNPSNKLLKIQGKLTKKVEQAVNRLVPRDTIFVPSELSSTNVPPDQSVLNSLVNYSELTLQPAAELSPLPRYDQVVPTSNEYRTSHLKSQDLGVDLIKAALQTEQERLRQLSEDNKMLSEYSNTLNFGEEEEDLRTEILALESELSRLRIMYPTLIPPPIPSRPQSTSDTHWTCPKCSEREPETSSRCGVCRLPSSYIPPEEAQACRCNYCSKIKLLSGKENINCTRKASVGNRTYLLHLLLTRQLSYRLGHCS